MGDIWDENAMKDQSDLATINKWEGEDEEEKVKESWDDVDSEEEKKDVEKAAEFPKAKPKPKKKVAEKIEEREKKAREEAEKKNKEKEEAITPEERRAEQLRRQKISEETDLRLAMETFGVTAIDAMLPDTAEDFVQFGDALIQKINQFNKHTEFSTFAENLIDRIAVNLSALSLKKLSTTINNLAIERQKLEKSDKSKKSKGKGKAKLKIEDENSRLSEYNSYDYDNEYDDFM